MDKQNKPREGLIDINPLVVADIQRRSEIGKNKYGKYLQSFNGRDALLDLYEELLDAAVYIRQKMEEERYKEFSYKCEIDKVNNKIRLAKTAEEKSLYVGLKMGLETKFGDMPL